MCMCLSITWPASLLIVIPPLLFVMEGEKKSPWLSSQPVPWRWAGLWVVGEGGTARPRALGCLCWSLHLSPGVWGLWGQASACSTSVTVLPGECPGVAGGRESTSLPLCSGQQGVDLYQILYGDGVDPVLGILLALIPNPPLRSLSFSWWIHQVPQDTSWEECWEHWRGEGYA